MDDLDSPLAVRREPNGTFVVRLDAGAADALRQLPNKLRSVLARRDFSDRVVQRLFPRAYRTEKEEAEYRKLLGDDLARRKLEGVEIFEKTLLDWREEGSHVEVRVTPEQFESWLGFVNDIRLVLGIELDIEDDGWEEDFHPLHPQAADMALLCYLGWLEDELLRAMP